MYFVIYIDKQSLIFYDILSNWYTDPLFLFIYEIQTELIQHIAI